MQYLYHHQRNIDKTRRYNISKIENRGVAGMRFYIMCIMRNIYCLFHNNSSKSI